MRQFALPLLLLATACAGVAEAFGQLSSHKEDPAALSPWRPPPEYTLGTTGHKTMYLTDVTVGNGQTFRLLVDTGSPMVVIPGAACSKCNKHFDSSGSKAANRTVSIKFGVGSLSGHIFQDRVCVQMPDGGAPLTEVGFLQRSSKRQSEVAKSQTVSGDGCAQVSFVVADAESDDFAGEPFDGILGLGLQSSSDGTGDGFSILSQLVKNGATQTTAFALHLSNSGNSQLLLGGADEASFAGGHAVWVPLSPAADGYWQFGVQDLTLNGQVQNFGGLQVAVDSGTSLLAADDELRDWFREHLMPKDCSAVDSLPKLGLRVRGGQILSILPADYIDQTDGKCSLALMPGHMQSVGGQRLILGDSFLRRYTTIFDRQNSRLGFGVAADDSMVNELLPGMFPDPVTTAAPATTEGPLPPEHLDYTEEQYAPVTTPPPPTPAQLEAKRREAELGQAFSGDDDLAGSFEASISHARGSPALPSAHVQSKSQQQVGEPAPSSLDSHNIATDGQADQSSGQTSGTDYLSFLKFLQISQLSLRRAEAKRSGYKD